MEPILSIIAGILILIIGVVVTLLAWIFLDTKSKVTADLVAIRAEARAEITSVHVEAKENVKELNRKYEKLDSELRSLENEKFNVIMIELGKMGEVVTVIQRDIQELKENQKLST